MGKTKGEPREWQWEKAQEEEEEEEKEEEEKRSRQRGHKTNVHALEGINKSWRSVA